MVTLMHVVPQYKGCTCCSMRHGLEIQRALLAATEDAGVSDACAQELRKVYCRVCNPGVSAVHNDVRMHAHQRAHGGYCLLSLLRSALLPDHT